MATYSLLAKNTTSENKSAVSKNKKPIVKKEKPKQSSNNLTLGKNKEDFHLEKGFDNMQLQVERIIDRIFQSSLKNRTEIKVKPKNNPQKTEH